MGIGAKKRFFQLALIIGMLIYLASCGKNTLPIKIGIAGTMTGIDSDLSVSGRRGVELAVNEFNRNGGLHGRKVELVVKDDKNDASTALKIDKEFINEKIPVVIGHYTSGMMIQSMKVLKDKDILFLAPTISADALSGLDDNFIRFITTTEQQAIALENMAQKNGDQSFAIVYDLKNKGFCEVLYKHFRKLLEKHGGHVILTKTFLSNHNKDYVHLAMDIIAAKPEAALIIASSGDNAELAQQLRKHGSKIQLYAPLWSNTIDLVRKGGTAVEGMYIVGAMDLQDKDPGFVKFKEDFIGIYGEPPTFASVYSYEAAEALFQAMKRGKDVKPATIKDNLIEIKNFKGLEGSYQIDRFGDNIRKYMIFRIETNGLRKVE